VARCVSSLPFDEHEIQFPRALISNATGLRATVTSAEVKRMPLPGQPSHAYGNLLRELAITDYKVKYQGSLLGGYVWSFAKPLLLFGVLYFVFTRFVRLGAGVPDYALQLLLGIVLWTYFADATVRGMSSIVERGDLIRKVYFPRLIIVVAASLSSLITLGLNLVVVVVFFVASGVSLRLTAPLFLVLVIELYALTLGCSFLLAALYVRFRDFKHIWELGLQLLFYASPIIYPLSFIPARWQTVFSLNPIAQIVQDSRNVLISPTLTTLDIIHSPLALVPYAIPVVVLFFGYLYFNRAAAAFAEEI
jgi:ABC-2 type transport system permease protein